MAIVSAGACRRGPRVSDEIYRQAVTSFYVSLAAMQTGQDVHARQELDRLTQLVPDEAAGWANLGLLLLRQQQIDEAATRLARASQLAPRNAAIERLLALTESRKGNARRIGAPLAARDRARLRRPQGAVRAGAGARTARRAGERRRGAARCSKRSRHDPATSRRRLEFARVAARRGDAAALARGARCAGAERAVVAGRCAGAAEDRAGRSARGIPPPRRRASSF